MLLFLALTVDSLQADWGVSQISRRAGQLYGLLGEGRQQIEAWQRLLQQQADDCRAS